MTNQKCLEHNITNLMIKVLKVFPDAKFIFQRQDIYNGNCLNIIVKVDREEKIFSCSFSMSPYSIEYIRSSPEYFNCVLKDIIFKLSKEMTKEYEDDICKSS